MGILVHSVASDYYNNILEKDIHWFCFNMSIATTNPSLHCDLSLRQ